MIGTTASDVCCLQGPRLEQEDRFRIFYSNGRCYVVVADGMGGYTGGSLAADAAVAAAERYLLTETGDIEEILRRAVEHADEAVRSKAAQTGCGDMGTTLLVACITDGRASIANVGDSRAYLILDDRVIRCTRDHTVASESPPGYNGRDAQYLTQALGHGELVDPDYYEYPFPVGGRIILCTDGVYKSGEQQFLLAMATAATPTEAVSRLKEALGSGQLVDNATAVVVDQGAFCGCSNPMRVELPLPTSIRSASMRDSGRSRRVGLLGWLLTGLFLGVIGVVGIQKFSATSTLVKPFSGPGRIINPNDEVFMVRAGEWRRVAPERFEVSTSERIPLVIGNAFGRVPVVLSFDRGKALLSPSAVKLSLKGLREQVNGEIVRVELADLEVPALDGYRVWPDQQFRLIVRKGGRDQLWTFVVRDGTPTPRGEPTPISSPTRSPDRTPQRRPSEGLHPSSRPVNLWVSGRSFAQTQHRLVSVAARSVGQYSCKIRGGQGGGG